MSKFLMQDCYIEIDGFDMSDHFVNVATPQTRERVDVSGFNPTGAKEFLAGDREDSITGTALQDFATGEVHDILSDLFQNQTTFRVRVRPTSAAVSATNPEFGGMAQLLTYTGLQGDKGSRAEIPVEIIPADVNGFSWTNT